MEEGGSGKLGGQESLLPAEDTPDGGTGVVEIAARSILTPASGFLEGYDYSLNPYSGCAFGCTYCYAAFFSRDQDLVETWGDWVKVKANAVALLRRGRTPLEGKAIYMSSVTDPYQPIERRLRLSRAILEELRPHQPRLVVQTRGPLITRDIDVLSGFKNLRVNVTVTTDDDDVRKVFEPSCPSNSQRLDAATLLAEAGLDVGITMTPLLPVRDPVAFAARVKDVGAKRLVVQPFHSGKGRFVRGTRRQALDLVDERGWTRESYEAVVRNLRREFPALEEGQAGFSPPP